MMLPPVPSEFAGEALLDYRLPNYTLERLQISAGLIICLIFWLMLVPYWVANYQGSSRIKNKTVTIRVRKRGKEERVVAQQVSAVEVERKELSTWVITVTVICCIMSCLLVLSFSSNNRLVSRGVFEAPLFTEEECKSLVKRSYVAAQRNAQNSTDDKLLEEPVGWQKARHATYPTIDLNLVTDSFLKEDRDYLANLLDHRLSPLMQRIYGIVPSAIRANDMFVVRYSPDTRSFLAKHTDDSDISFIILLSDDFEDGGTRYWNRLTNEPFADVQPTKVGTIALHPAILHHEGLPTTRGVRHILAGFLSIDHADPWTRKPTGLSWFVSWFALNHWQARLKEGYEAAHLRREKKLEGSRWTDHPLARSLFRDFINVLQYLGDILSPHLHYRLVSEDNADEFVRRLDQGVPARNKANWFAGQNVELDFDGTITRGWRSRRKEGGEAMFQDL